MHLSSINVGTSKEIGRFTTGIDKRAVDEAIQVSSLGLPNDAICDTKYHGGEDQALYVYGGVDYAYWKGQLDRELQPGEFGDNLTVAGLSCKQVCIGDKLNIGEVLLEVTAPRIPCATLGAKMGDSKFPLAFRQAKRPGFYTRVLREGLLSAGTEVIYEKVDSTDPVELLEVFERTYDPEPPISIIDRILSAPVASRERARLTELRAKLTNA